MLRRTALTALALGTALVCAGCAGTVLDPIAPEISVADFALTGLDPLRQTGELQLSVANPNRFGLSGRGLQADLTLDGRPVGRAVSTGPFNIPAGATTTVPLSTTMDLAAAATLAPTLLRGGEVDYTLAGTAAFDAMGGRPTSFSRSGRARIVRDAVGGFAVRTN